MTRVTPRILVIGDLMTDDYITVSSERKAVESGLPVWDQVSREIRPGGAANVAANLLSMPGCGVTLAGIGVNFSVDVEGACNFPPPPFDSIPMRKTRFFDVARRPLARYDDRKKYFADEVFRFREWLRSSISNPENRPDFKVIVFSDYDKGTVDGSTVRLVREHYPDAIYVVDSKRKDLSIFSEQGKMDVLKVNASEYAAQETAMSRTNARHVTALFKNVVETRGSKGSRLHYMVDQQPLSYTIDSEDFPVQSKKEVDVTGCGDTHTATMAYCLANGANIREAIRLANDVASSVVSKFGTSVPDMDDVMKLRSFFLSRQENS